MRRAITVCIIAALTAADQLIKYVVDLRLSSAADYPSADGFIALHYIENTGAAFSLFREHTALLTVITGIMLAGCLVALMSGKIKSRFLYCSIVLICSGGAGNFIDRIARGYVIDYIELLFVNFAVFNFADCLVTVGAFLMLIYIVCDTAADIKRKKLKSNTKED